MDNYQTPSNNPPALIKFFFGSRMHLGEVNIGSFYLTLLDLINRKYVSVKIVRKKYKFNEKTHDKNDIGKKSNSEHRKILEKIILQINRQSAAKLHPFEKNVLRCIYALKCKGNIDICNTKDAIRKRLKVSTFQKNYDAWMENFYNEFIKKNEFKHSNNKVSQILGMDSWTKEGKELKEKWDLFKNYHKKNLKTSGRTEEFFNEGINYIPYLLALGIPKTLLINNFNQATNISDTLIFLKYGTDSLINDIVKDFLQADGSFDPKYYNTSGNFVPGFGL
ncbi:MAG: DUF2207 domain-containing protein [Methanobrevibacter sp.]|nr:DUF2207 domain-containing protein [Methanobrevibacter sp.]